MAPNTSRYSIIKTLIIIVVVFIVLFPLFYFMVSFLVIGYEPVSDKKELNNPIVNSDYSGWQEVVLSNEETTMLPAEWNITANDVMTVISNGNGQVIAKGGQLLRGEESYYQYDQLLSKLLGYTVSDVTLTVSGTVRSSEYGTVTIDNESQTTFHYVLLAKTSDYDMLFIFDPIAEKEYSNLITILEAVVFSYVWGSV